MSIDRAANRKLAIAWAPIVWLHSDEQYFPDTPEQFIEQCRFRHHRGGDRDHGFNKESWDWVETDSGDPEYYDIPIDAINAYGLNSDGTNCRPRDPKSGQDHNLFLEHRDARPTGVAQPTGVVPTFAFGGMRFA